MSKVRGRSRYEWTETCAQDSTMVGQRQKPTMMSKGNKVKIPNIKLLFQETWLSEDNMRHQQGDGVQHQGEDPEQHVKDGAEEAENELN